MADRLYSFGPFRLYPERGSLFEDSKRVRLGTRALEILIALVERAGEVVSNQDLIARVWPETFVEDNNLRVHLALLRKALRDGQDQVRYILNVPGRGYRFAVPVLTLPLGRAGSVANLVEQFQGHRSGEQPVLSDKQMLIVLDSCEYVIEQVAALVEAVQCLVTSREPLRAEGE
jgi:DNA-binding winged helix-turn-helix (wHTH) protein